LGCSQPGAARPGAAWLGEAWLCEGGKARFFRRRWNQLGEAWQGKEGVARQGFMILTATTIGDRFRLRGPYAPEFYRSLPDSRWDKAARCWTCRATPATAWRLFGAEWELSADETVHQLHDQFIRRNGDNKGQPPLCVSPSWQHQCEAYWFAEDRHAALVAMGMGTGKSKVVVDLVQNKQMRRILVICPTSVRRVWPREFDRHSIMQPNMLVLDRGTVKKKTQSASMFVETPRPPAVVVVNYETAWRPDFLKWASSVEWDLVVCDESHRIKGHNSKVSKGCAAIGRGAKHRLCLTGTPMSHSPLDLFGQFRFLDPGLFGTSYHRFRNLYAISGPFGANHIVGFKNQDDLARKMALLTYQVGSEVLDLPEAMHHEVDVVLSAKSRRQYDGLRDEMIAEVADGTITVANGLVKLLRLQQMTSGFCSDEKGTEHLLGSDKQDALSDLLDGIDTPAVVFCRFRHDLDSVRQVSEKLGRRFGELSGRVNDLTDDATMPDDIDVMAVQIQAGGVGIDLTLAAYAIYYSTGFSLGEYEQSMARVHRPGQRRTVHYYHLLAENSVDGIVFNALRKKRKIVDEVLDYLKGESDG